MIRIPAHAKINLHLAIGGRRPDGYHDVETVLQTLALHDTLTFEHSDSSDRHSDGNRVSDGGATFTLRCDVAGVPLDSSNLVARAAALLVEAAGLGATPGACVTIEKRIPMQAGLGGGSADAAAALIGLARLWQLRLDPRQLHALGARLGADVPFFLDGGTALGVGRGDELRPLPDLPPHAVLLVMPPLGVSTADAYRWLDEARATAAATPAATATGAPADAATPGMARPSAPLASAPAGVPAPTAAAAPTVTAASGPRWPETPAEWPARLSRCRNDFEPVVGARIAAVPDAVGRLKQAGASWAAMSGSGAALFGLFKTAVEAESAAKMFAQPGWRTFVSQTIDRASYQQSIRLGMDIDS